ncbi:MAG: hypothetical protein OEM07_00475 [Gammaproteobacteria bacterium]|nr:hypothetical protein [Gammaproteobacteria bacterium]
MSRNQIETEVIHTVYEGTITNSYTNEKQHADNHPHLINRRFRYVGELSKYFKERSQGSDIHPGIKEKLEHSVWEHIHAAIRYAHQGNEYNSKIHTDIACNACKELAHYMDDEAYRLFTIEVAKHLSDLKSGCEIKNSN